MVKIINKRGSIGVAADVFSNIAGDAATRCFGVKGMVRQENGFWKLLRRESMKKGVVVSFDDGDNTVSIALHIGVGPGVNLAALGRSIMGEVSYKVSAATGVEVKRVDVHVDAMLAE